MLEVAIDFRVVRSTLISLSKMIKETNISHYLSHTCRSKSAARIKLVGLHAHTSAFTRLRMQYLTFYLKRYKIWPELKWNTNRKTYAIYRISAIFNDLE